MPATPLPGPPGIRCVFSDGTAAEFILEGLPCPQLVSDLLAGLAELVHPHGSIDAANSVDLCLPPIRSLVTSLAARGFDGGAAELRRGLLVEYWMGTRSFRWENRLRRMLRGFDTATGRLDPGVRELLAGRPYASTPHRQPLPPYSEREWARLASACQEITDKSYAAHRMALAAAARGTSPALESWTVDNLAWLLARLGPVGTSASPATCCTPPPTPACSLSRSTPSSTGPQGPRMSHWCRSSASATGRSPCCVITSHPST